MSLIEFPRGLSGRGGFDKALVSRGIAPRQASELIPGLTYNLPVGRVTPEGGEGPVALGIHAGDLVKGHPRGGREDSPGMRRQTREAGEETIPRET